MNNDNTNTLQRITDIEEATRIEKLKELKKQKVGLLVEFAQEPDKIPLVNKMCDALIAAQKLNSTLKTQPLEDQRELVFLMFDSFYYSGQLQDIKLSEIVSWDEDDAETFRHSNIAVKAIMGQVGSCIGLNDLMGALGSDVFLWAINEWAASRGHSRDTVLYTSGVLMQFVEEANASKAMDLIDSMQGLSGLMEGTGNESPIIH